MKNRNCCWPAGPRLTRKDQREHAQTHVTAIGNFGPRGPTSVSTGPSTGRFRRLFRLSCGHNRRSPRPLNTPPTEKTRLRNYFFDTFGPYPIVISAIAAGINQAENTPPEWKQDAAGYGRRFGSNCGIAAVTTTTRCALSRAFREDALYYRCACKRVSAVGPCTDFFLHGTPRRRWP